MFRFASASLLLVFSCACSAAEVEMHNAQVGTRYVCIIGATEPDAQLITGMMTGAPKGLYLALSESGPIGVRGSPIETGIFHILVEYQVSIAGRLQPPRHFEGVLTVAPEPARRRAARSPVVPHVEDLPPLVPVVIRLLWITWREGEKPNPVELYVSSSHAGYEEISFSAAPSVSWLHVKPETATTPAKLSVWADPAVPDAAGEIVISGPGAKWQPVYIRVNTEMIKRGHSEITAAVNGASLSAGLAPGAVVTLFGSHLGPVDLVVSRPVGGAYQTEIAQTRFTLDGAPCPILYVSGGQSSIILPYAVQPGKHTLEVTTTYAGTTYTGTVVLDIAHVAPGVFTLLANGRGHAVALDSDYSLNSAENPAKPGSYIIVYATGLGELESPPLKDGAIENRIVRHKTVPTASVGKQPAFVYFAGAAPGFVSGVSQVNVQIPADAPSGEVELKLTSEKTSSQDGVTIFVQHR